MAKLKNKIGLSDDIETKSNIEQAIVFLQTAQACINAHAAERTAKQLHVGTLSQLNKELGDIRKILLAYVNG